MVEDGLVEGDLFYRDSIPGEKKRVVSLTIAGVAKDQRPLNRSLPIASLGVSIGESAPETGIARVDVANREKSSACKNNMSDVLDRRRDC